MSVKSVSSIPLYTGVSSDVKPTGVMVGSKFIETNTGIEYTYDGSAWNILVSNATLSTALSNQIDSISITGTRATYSCGGSISSFAASATTVVELIGSSTKTIKLRRILLGLKATAAGNWIVSLNKNSTVSTGGTSTTPAITPYSSTLAAASASVKQFSANPNGAPTQVGTSLRGGNLQVTNTGTPTFIGQYEWKFGDLDQMPPTLVAATESLSITLNGISAPSGGALDYILEWTEE